MQYHIDGACPAWLAVVNTNTNNCRYYLLSLFSHGQTENGSLFNIDELTYSMAMDMKPFANVFTSFYPCFLLQRQVAVAEKSEWPTLSLFLNNCIFCTLE